MKLYFINILCTNIDYCDKRPIKIFYFQGDGDVDGAADESFGSVGADDGKSGTGGGKLTLKLLLDHGLIEVKIIRLQYIAKY